MSEFKNPFLEENFVNGGGLWDGKTITILSAVARTKTGVSKLGAAFTRNELAIIAAADGEGEREETYSAGSLVPTADGEGFTKADGSPAAIHSNTELSKFIRGLKGFDTLRIFDPKTGAMRFSGLRGVRAEMQGVEKKDKDGATKTHVYNGKTYTDYTFYPVKFVGFKDGVASAPVASADVSAKAQALVLELLSENGGTLKQVDLVRLLGAKLNGDADRVAIITAITKPDFHAGAPWSRAGSTLTL